MSNDPTPFEALKTAVSRAGSQTAFANFIGVKQSTVWKWLQCEKPLPAEYVLKAEQKTGVSRHLLRPDIYPIDHPPFAPDAGIVTNASGNGPCDRQPDLQRSEEAEPPLPFASVTQRQEQQK